MELRHLRSFVFVAETQSFSIAATRCYLTQSAISQHVKALEHELGCKLLFRTSHKIVLTENGEELLPRAKEIIKMTEDCKEHINFINNVITGELRIGVGSFITPYIRKAALIFMERYPNVRVSAEFTKACRLNSLLRSHSIDLAFTMNTAFKEEGIETQRCIPFSIYAIMRDTHPLAHLREITYDDLMRHPIVMPDVGERAFNSVQQYFKQDLTKLNVKCIVSNPDEALAVVEETNCITFASKLHLKFHSDLIAKPIECLTNQRLYSNGHWMQDVPLKRSAQLFLEIIQQESVPYLNAIEDAL